MVFWRRRSCGLRRGSLSGSLFMDLAEYPGFRGAGARRSGFQCWRLMCVFSGGYCSSNFRRCVSSCIWMVEISQRRSCVWISCFRHLLSHPVIFRGLKFRAPRRDLSHGLAEGVLRLRFLHRRAERSLSFVSGRHASMVGDLHRPSRFYCLAY